MGREDTSTNPFLTPYNTLEMFMVKTKSLGKTRRAKTFIKLSYLLSFLSYPTYIFALFEHDLRVMWVYKLKLK